MYTLILFSFMFKRDEYIFELKMYYLIISYIENI